MLKIQLCITGINYILKYIQIKYFFFLLFHNIPFFFCICDQINAALVSIRLIFDMPLYNIHFSWCNQVPPFKNPVSH